MAFQPEKSLDGFRGFLLGEAQIVEALQIVPQPRARAKEMSEAQGGVALYRGPLRVRDSSVIGLPSQAVEVRDFGVRQPIGASALYAVD